MIRLNCPNCGWEIPDDSDYCQRCGSKLREGQRDDTDNKSAGKRSVKRTVITFCAAFLMMASGSALLSSGLKNNRLDRLVSAARDLAASQDWEAAAGAYASAFELKPDDRRLLDEMHDFWLTVQLASSNASGEGLHERAVEIARLLARVEPWNDTGNITALRSAFLSWVQQCADGGDRDGAESVIEDASDELPGRDISDMRQYAEDLLEASAIRESVRPELALLLKASPDTYKTAARQLMEQQADALTRYDSLGGWFPITVRGDDGISAGIWGYDGQYQVYIGGMDEYDRRTGAGENWFLDLNDDSFYWDRLVCDAWADDVPAGNFTETVFRSGGQVFRSFSGQMTEGFYDGEVEGIWDDGVRYIFRFDEGILTVQDYTDPDGNEANVVAYTADRKKWISFQEDALMYIWEATYIY